MNTVGEIGARRNNKIAGTRDTHSHTMEKKCFSKLTCSFDENARVMNFSLQFDVCDLWVFCESTFRLHCSHLFSAECHTSRERETKRKETQSKLAAILARVNESSKSKSVFKRRKRKGEWRGREM